MKKILKSIFGRLSIIALFIILQLLVFIGLLYRLNEYFAIVNIINTIISFLIIFSIFSRRIPEESKITWIIVILVIPIFGVVAYIMFSKNRLSIRQSKLIRKIKMQIHKINEKHKNISINQLLNVEQNGQLDYLEYVSSNIAYINNEVSFFPKGELFFEDLLIELKKAKQFIFMEYFIIDHGKMLDSIIDILAQKVQEGVEVRFLYDDFGSINTVSFNFDKELRKRGIDAHKFNRFVPIVSSIHNNRDHRKITVIDGKVAYTGGLNLADEYINEIHPHGEWKDSALKIKGDAVDGLTMMFLSTYNLVTRKEEDFTKYLGYNTEIKNNNVVIPYGDGPRPYYDEYIGENVYINIINSAKKYLWITTPYLICDSKIKSALEMAAMRGVDVRIVLPHIPDKKLIFAISRSNYKELIERGVKIYEFKNGFIHAKQFLSDDVSAIVGTINLDYRSLLHHFEDGVILFNQEVIFDIKKDFENIFSESISMLNYKQNIFIRLGCKLLEVFQPLL